MWVKKTVWVLTVWLKEQDKWGEDLNWSSPSIEDYAFTLEEARAMKEEYESGQNEYYGDNVESVDISDEPEERELLDIWS